MAINGQSTFDISPRWRLDDAIRKPSNLLFRETDCSLPMLCTLKTNLKIDMFCIYTGSKGSAGVIYPSQTLQQYRQKSGIPAKLVVGMTSNGFTLADPVETGVMDVVGYDPAIRTNEYENDSEAIYGYLPVTNILIYYRVKKTNCWNLQVFPKS